MKIFAIFSIFLLCFSFSGCILLEDDDVFVWPEVLDSECIFENNKGLSCSPYLEDFAVPHMSVKHPSKDEIWIIDLDGLIKSWDGLSTETVANLSSIISRCHFEQGLLGFAFDQNFNTTDTILLSYIESGSCEDDNEADLILASAKIDDLGLLDLTSIIVLKVIDQPYRNHNGGYLQSIGNNEYLWGIGDGGGSNDPDSNGQEPNTPLGTIQYFTYTENGIIPILNNSNLDDYTLHYGLRNPWRFDLDSNDRLWVTDVGQNCWEEVNLVSLTETSNLGWSEREAFHRFHSNGYTNENGTCYLDEDEPSTPKEMTDPIVSYLHDGGNCSIIGGEWMDWGPDILHNGYIYGDFCSGSIWIIQDNEGIWVNEYIGKFSGMIVGFGRGLSDEILVFTWDGTIYSVS